MLRSQNIPSRLVKGVIPYKSGLIPNDLANYESHINLEVYDGRTWFMINPTLYNPIDKNKLLFNVKGMDKTVIRGMTIDKESEFKFIPFVQVSPFSSTYTEHFKFNLEDVDFLMYTVN